MSFGKSLKSHFLAYRFFYVVYFFLCYFFIGVSLLFFIKNEQLTQYLFLIVIACSLVFTLLLGIYEYQVLFPTYLGLSNLKRRFHVGNFIFNIFHSIIMLTNVLILFIIISVIIFKNIAFIYPYNKFSLYCLMWTVHLFVYAGAGFLTILFRRILFLIKFLLLCLIGTAGYYMQTIVLFFENIIKDVLNNFKHCLLATFIFFAGFLIIHLLIILKK